jgi:putative NADH-flavin reductase
MVHSDSRDPVALAGDAALISTMQDLLGTSLSDERFPEILAAFDDVLAEIRKLRSLDLKDVHPAIIFEPTAPYRAEGEK